MRAKVITTQELVDVVESGYDPIYNVKMFVEKRANNPRYFNGYDLEFLDDTPQKNINSINWEQRRYELAKEALNGMLSHSRNGHGYKPRDPNMNWHDAIAEEALEIADAVIKKLKEE